MNELLIQGQCAPNKGFCKQGEHVRLVSFHSFIVLNQSLVILVIRFSIIKLIENEMLNKQSEKSS